MANTYLGAILNPLSPSETEFIAKGALSVTDDGKIAFCGSRDKVPKKFLDRKTNLGRLVIIPGFIDMHVHLPQYDITAVESESLLAWLENHVYPEEVRLANPSRAEEISKRFFYDLKLNGTTTACVYTTVHQSATNIAFEAAEKAGVRVIMGKVMTDMEVPKEHLEETKDSLKQSEELCKKWHKRDDGRLQYSFIPRAAPACSRKLMKEASELAKKYGAYIQTHLAESYEDLQWLRESHGPVGYVEVYQKCGLLGPKSIMAHAIHLTETELQTLANTNTSIAHCPSSNLFLVSGVMDIRERMKRGIRIGLGSDVAGGPSLSMFREMAMAGFASKALATFRKFLSENLAGVKAELKRLRKREVIYTRIIKKLHAAKDTLVVDPKLAFYLATLGGATALGLQAHIGSLREGKEADFVVIDPYRIDTKRGAELFKDAERLLSQLMYRGDDRVVMKTFVRGREIFSAP